MTNRTNPDAFNTKPAFPRLPGDLTHGAHLETDAIGPPRTFASKSQAVRTGRRRRTPTQLHPFQPALRKPLTRWAWSSGRNHGALVRTYISNAAGARETAFSNASFASAVRPSWPSAAAYQR